MKQLKNRYRLFRCGWGVYYAFNNETGNGESLKTRDKAEATRLLHAMNEAARLTQLNLQIARANLNAGDPQITMRTWRYIVDEIIKLKTGPTQHRWQSAAKDDADGQSDCRTVATRDLEEREYAFSQLHAMRNTRARK